MSSGSSSALNVDRRALAAEAGGTALLLWVIVISGIVVSRFPVTASDIERLAVHALMVGLALTVIIALLGPVSGAHLNPAVTIAAVLRGMLPRSSAVWYVAAQVLGGVVGVLLANVSAGLPVATLARQQRGGMVLIGSEIGATAGLVLIILLLVRRNASLRTIAAAVGLYITAAIVVSPSTAFANPAVTFARTLSDTYTGIAPASVGGFVTAQLVGALIAVVIVTRSLPVGHPTPPAPSTRRRAS
jgi:glycerol uptake facilitator-like aquaporin